MNRTAVAERTTIAPDNKPVYTDALFPSRSPDDWVAAMVLNN